MELDYWVVLYDADTGNVWAEMVHGGWLETVVFATWIKDTAGGEPRYHAAVVPGWESIPDLAEVLGGGPGRGMGLDIFTRWSPPPPQREWTVSSTSLVPTDEPRLGEGFVREWMEIFERHRPRMQALRERITECGLTDESPEVHRMIVTCITEAMNEIDLSTITEPDPAIVKMLECFDRELTALGCEPAGKPLNPWLVGGLAAGGVVLIGGGIYLATRD